MKSKPKKGRLKTEARYQRVCAALEFHKRRSGCARCRFRAYVKYLHFVILPNLEKVEPIRKLRHGPRGYDVKLVSTIIAGTTILCDGCIGLEQRRREDALRAAEKNGTVVELF